jgi:hypothetical protein
VGMQAGDAIQSTGCTLGITVQVPPDQAATGRDRGDGRIDDGPDAEDGEALIVSTIADITEFLATVDVGSSPVAELHYTQTGGKGGKGGKSKGGKGGKGNRRMLDFERNRIRDYYANESDADRRQRQASRAKDTCATCGQLGHWRMDPECKGARDEGEAHVTEVGTDSD